MLAAKAAGVEIVGDIELFRRAKGNVRVIGITGTNGKSTTTALAGHILKEAQMSSAVGGNIGEAILTLPDLPAASTYVIEMSSYQIDLCPTFAPDIAVHINFSPRPYRPPRQHGGICRGQGALVPRQGHRRHRRRRHVVAGDVRPREARGPAQGLPVSCLKAYPDGVTVSADGVLYDQQTKIIDLKTCPNLKGQHNWQNAAMAYAACVAVGAPTMKIVKGMQSFPGLAHRQNIVATIGNVSYVNDSKATNDQAAAMALRTFENIYWIAGGKSKSSGYGDCEKYIGHVRHAFLIGAAAEEIGLCCAPGKSRPRSAARSTRPSPPRTRWRRRTWNRASSCCCRPPARASTSSRASSSAATFSCSWCKSLRPRKK